MTIIHESLDVMVFYTVLILDFIHILVKRIRLFLGWITLHVAEHPIGKFYLVYIYWMT